MPDWNPTRGDLPVRRMVVHLPGLPDWTSRVTIPNATSPAPDRILSMGCQSIIIPHPPSLNPVSHVGPRRDQLLVGGSAHRRPDPRDIEAETR